MSSKKDENLEPETVETVEEYLARGGKITQCKPFARTENLVVGQWGRKNAKKTIENPTEAPAESNETSDENSTGSTKE